MKIKRERNPKILNHFKLSINGLEVKDKSFIKNAKILQFPNYKQLHLENMDFIEDNEVDDINEFFMHSSPYSLKQMYLHGSLDNWPKIDRFVLGMDNLFGSLTEVAFFHSFQISQKHLATIIEGCRYVNRLVIYWWKWVIDQDFALDPKLEYRIELLDLFRTWNTSDNECITEKWLAHLIIAMGKTNLLRTLRYFHVREKDFKGIIAQNLFDKHRFRVRVKGDDDYPMLRDY